MNNNKKQIRVLHVLGALNIGGAETMVMNLYRNIDREHIQFDFVIHTDEHCDFTDEIIALGGRIYSCPRYVGKNHIQYCNWWKKFFQDHNEYHIVHGHVRSTAALYLYIAHKTDCITISHSHSTSNGNGISAIVKKTLQYPIHFVADYLFACSDEAGRWLFGSKSLSKENYFFFPNAINIVRYQYDENKRNAIREKYHIEDKLVLGTVGRIIEAKNPYGLLDIVEKAYGRNKALILIWVGTGELEKTIKEEVKKRGLEDAILFMGNRTDVPDLMQAFDVFVFPSLWEGLPVTVVEAQAAGLPCLVSDKVTKQVAVSSLVKYLPIDEGFDEWVNEIFNVSLERLDVTYEIQQAGFDISESVLWLKKFYENL